MFNVAALWPSQVGCGGPTLTGPGLFVSTANTRSVRALSYSSKFRVASDTINPSLPPPWSHPPESGMLPSRPLPFSSATATGRPGHWWLSKSALPKLRLPARRLASRLGLGLQTRGPTSFGAGRKAVSVDF